MSSRAGRATFVVNTTVTVALLAVVAAIALIVKPPAPPGIAAFAPQANKPITKAPPGQSSTSGRGAGQCAAGQVCEGPVVTATPRVPFPTASASRPLVAGVPSSLQCYTWPDGTVTQTFDPQSPPCIASWPDAAKGNGGATSQGVTSTEIRIAVPVSPTDSQFRQFEPIAQFFNTHFQLYGRRLRLVPLTSQQLTGADVDYTNASKQKADAEGISALKPFAAVDFLDGTKGIYTIPMPEYLNTLSQHGVVASVGGNLPPNSTSLDGNAPYQWTYLPTLSSVMRGVGGLVCRQLVGRTASHSPSMAGLTRKFALVLSDPSQAGGRYPGLSGLLDQLASCGVKDPRVVYAKDTDQTLSASMTQLRQDGVTTLLYLPSSAIGSSTPQSSAQNVGYFPEWVLFGGNPMIMTNILSGPKSQTENTIGVSGWDKTLPPALQPWRRAFLEMGGSTTAGIRGGRALYLELQLLASGIQMAGPDLTPETFAQALRETRFANPGAGAAPAYQPRVDYQAGGHELVQDFAGYWFDATASYGDAVPNYARQDYEHSKSFCWVDLGTRWAADAWPRTDHFRQGRCR